MAALVSTGAMVAAHGQAAAAGANYTLSTFKGLAYDGWEPGEPSVAVGSTYVVETVNTMLAVYTRAGRLSEELLFSSLFPPAPNPVSCTDPTVVYAAWVQRYAIACWDIGAGNTDALRLAVSRGSNPNGGWYTWATAPGSGVDQPSFEITKDKLMLLGSGSGSSAFWVYQLSDLLSGVMKPRVHTFVVSRGQFRAAVEISGSTTAYAVQAYPGNDVYLVTVTGTPATAVAWRLSTLSYDFMSPPTEPSIPDGHLGDGHLDGRVLHANYEVTSAGAKIIEFSQMAECGGRNCNVDGRITLGRSGPVLSYLHTLSASGYDDTFGTVTVDGAGQPILAYSRSSPTQAPEAAVITSGLDKVVWPDPAGVTACAPGSSPPCDERWGDYLGAVRDPSYPSVVWLTGLVQAASGGWYWSTVITSVTV
ncbi:MAG: hypothetical protein ACREPI_01790 [Candidatus Dormibacterales bacterium]